MRFSIAVLSTVLAVSSAAWAAPAPQPFDLAALEVKVLAPGIMEIRL